MNRKDYRAAFDAIPFREDFQRRTVQMLRQGAERPSQKECFVMKKKRVALIAACLSALLVVSAAAAALLLSPKDVAQRLGDQTLAQVFQGEDAVAINETAVVGDYNVTLMGMVSGAGLSDYTAQAPDLVDERTYAVLAMARTDGAAFEGDTVPLTVTPLVEGFAPWQVNAWTLEGGYTWFVENGVVYYLFECDSVEPFADHTVYLAAYEGWGMAPSAEMFSFEDGKIGVRDGQDVSLFTLALDPAKADPAGVAERFPALPQTDEAVSAPDADAQTGTEDDKGWTYQVIQPDGADGDIQLVPIP